MPETLLVETERRKPSCYSQTLGEFMRSVPCFSDAETITKSVDQDPTVNLNQQDDMPIPSHKDFLRKIFVLMNREANAPFSVNKSSI
jgi:hypothetical protein